MFRKTVFRKTMIPNPLGRFLWPLSVVLTIALASFAAWAVTSPVNDWKIAGPFGGTAITVALDSGKPGVVLAGGMNSLMFRSDDAGANWSLLNFPKRNLSEVTSILVDPADSNHIFGGMISAEDGGLFESHDAGQTWHVAKDMSDFGVRALAASASKPSRFVAGTLRGVWLSDDSGKSWRRISDPDNLEMQGVTAVAIDTKDPEIIYAGTSHLPWKTSDGGKTWESIHTGMIDDSDVFSIYVDPSDPSDVLASACSGIYSSADRGGQWKKLLGIPNTSRRTHVIREDPTNASVLYAGTTTGLFKSVNRGVNWKTLTNTQVNSLSFDPTQPGTMYLALEYEGVGKSSNSGEAINLTNQGFVDRSITGVAVSGKKLISIESQNGESSAVFESSDRGESWSQISTARGLGGVHLTAIAGLPSEERILIAASARQMYKSIDGGQTWKPLPVRLEETPPPAPEKPKPAAPARTRSTKPTTAKAHTNRPAKPTTIVRQVSLAQVNGLYSIKSGTKDVVFAATDLGLLRSSDAGEHWTMSSILGSPAAISLHFSANFDGHLVVRTASGLFASSDYGDHWTELKFPLPMGDIKDIAVPASPDCPLFVATRLGLYSSVDEGSKWYANLGGIPASTVSAVLYSGSEKQAYAVQYGQLYKTDDGGQHWKQVATAVPSLHIRQLWKPDPSSERLYGITSDIGILFRN